MGEIRWGGNSDTFIMQTPDGIRPVTLRCSSAGIVHVEEITDDGVSAQPLKITRMETAPQNSVNDIANDVAQQVTSIQQRLKMKRSI